MTVQDSDPFAAGAADGRRVALIHYWLVGMRGGEKVLEALCRMFPQADIFTHVVVPERISPALRRHAIYQTRVGRLPFAPRLYQKYLPLMPRALEELDLSGYDLVISSESGPAKGVIAPPNAPHLCYCHSPMRYLWDQYTLYLNGAGGLTRLMMPHLAHPLRQWDVTSAARVDGFVANSAFVARRIEKYWRRGADVVHPPVAVQEFAPIPAAERGDYYLWVGELTHYKRPDIAVEAFRRLGLPFKMLGGPDKLAKALARQAGPRTQILGKRPFAELKALMAGCKALIFPGEEDFGMVPVEAMASGRPVIALGRGGALETVVEGETGLFFHDQSVEALVDAVERFEASGLGRDCTAACVARAADFSEERFVAGIRASLARIGA